MVGDATRIPLVQQKIKEVFGVDQVHRTLNSIECVARGASLQAAMLSPLFKVADYEVQEYNLYPVSISYSFGNQEGAEQKVITKELFPLGSSFPSTKTITFDNKKGGMDLLVHYSQGVQIVQGLPTQIAQYKIKEGKPKHDKVSFILRVSNNIHQIPCLESAELQEEWQEEEKIPVKKDTPAQAKPAEQPAEGTPDVEMKEEQKEAPKQEYEIRKKNKKSTQGLGVDSSSHALPPNVRSQFNNLENTWFSEDQKILDLKAIKNELEGFSYDMKNNIDSYGPYEKYVDESLRQQFLNQLSQTVDWIYGEGQTASIEVYRQKLDAFKKIGIPIKNRYRFHSEIEIYLEQFKAFSQEINDKLSTATNLTDQGRSDIISKFTEMESYFNVIKQTISSKPLHEDTGFDIDDVHMKLDTFKQVITQLLNAQPPKEEPKSQPQKEDVEMKEDAPTENK